MRDRIYSCRRWNARLNKINKIRVRYGAFVPRAAANRTRRAALSLKLTGDATRNVALVSDFAGVGQAAEVGPNVPAGALSLK